MFEFYSPAASGIVLRTVILRFAQWYCCAVLNGGAERGTEGLHLFVEFIEIINEKSDNK